MFWKTHCHAWWRSDIALTRSFPFIVSLALFFLSIPTQRFSEQVGALVTLSPLAIIVPISWNNTELPSTGFFIPGVLLTICALCYAWYKQGSRVTRHIVVWLAIVLAIGSAGIAFQSFSVMCGVYPAGVGHTILGFVPPLLALLA